jgi:hypothetical protein
MYYVNVRRNIRWVHKNKTAVPYAKGEGASLMVADFVSPDISFLCSPCGTVAAHWLFKAGKQQDGYFTNADILDHTTIAMDIVSEHYPNNDLVFVFDNTPSHLKRAEDALSA